MAAYRPIHISYWQDKFILKLTPEQKYFYLYLMTNSKTKQCGIYELPKNIICFETGYNNETISKLISYFVDQGKILYDEDTEEIYIKNWIKFNQIDNKNICICVLNELKDVKSRKYLVELFNCIENINVNEKYSGEIKGLVRGLIDPTKKETEEEEETESKEETKTESKEESIDSDFNKFWDLYNKKVGDKNKIAKEFIKLSKFDKTKIFETLPEYISSTPDKKFRKNPETYLNNHSWNDETIKTNLNGNGAIKSRRNTLQDF